MNVQGNRKWWVLGALAIGILAVSLDMTILNLALPILARDLQATNGQLQWFADAYNLLFAAALLPAGLLGDRLGRKKILITGLIVFGAASVMCAYSGSTWELITGRAILGLGAALLVPLSMSIIPVLFSEKERPRAIAVWMMANAFGIPLGPIVGGWLLDNYWWGSVFLINVPLVLVALFAVTWLLPESRNERSGRVDFIGILSSSFGLVGVTYGVIEVGEKGWGSSVTLSMIIAGFLALAVFIVWERHNSQPLIDPSLFRSPSFTWGTILATLLSFSMYGVLFVTPQYFQAVEGADALSAGLRLLPLVGGLLIGSQLADFFQLRFGGRKTIMLGFFALGVGLVIGAQTGANSGYGFTSMWLTVVGLGIGIALPAAMDAAMSPLSTDQSGVGSALIMALRQVGGTMGVAILGTVLSTRYRATLDTVKLPSEVAEAVKRNVSAGAAVARQVNSTQLLDSVRSAFIHGMNVVLWVCGGMAIVGIALTLVFLQQRTVAKSEPETKYSNIGE
ncbi:MAG: MFS transporter [Gorillibacterium sp.]|nr:MFS transporter [Gorillibacterium sp.]